MKIINIAINGHHDGSFSLVQNLLELRLSAYSEIAESILLGHGG
jgi:hypothetical protein